MLVMTYQNTIKCITFFPISGENKPFFFLYLVIIMFMPRLRKTNTKRQKMRQREQNARKVILTGKMWTRAFETFAPKTTAHK